MNNGFIKTSLILINALCLINQASAETVLSFDGTVMPVVKSEVMLPEQITTWRLVKPWGSLVLPGDIILHYQVQVDPSDCIQWAKSYYQIQNEFLAVNDPDKTVEYLELSQQWSEKKLACERQENHLIGTHQLLEKGLVALESYEKEQQDYYSCQNQEKVLEGKQQEYLDKMNTHQMSWYQSMLSQLDRKMKWCENPQRSWEWSVDSDGLLWPKEQEEEAIVLVDGNQITVRFLSDEEDIKALSVSQPVQLWFNGQSTSVTGYIQSIGLKPIDGKESFARYLVQVNVDYPQWPQSLNEGEHVRVEVETGD